MRKKEREYREALTAFNRSAGQIKRFNPEIDVKSYVSGATTAYQVNKALDKLKYDVERKGILERAAAYEARLDAMYEEMLKEEDLERHYEERDTARDTLNDRYGLDWDEEDAEEFWDLFGEKDLIDSYGSDQLIALGDRFMDYKSLRPSKVAKIAKKVAAEYTGQEKSQEDMMDLLDKALQKEMKRKAKKAKKKGKG